MVHDASKVWKSQKELNINFLKFWGSAEHGHDTRPCILAVFPCCAWKCKHTARYTGVYQAVCALLYTKIMHFLTPQHLQQKATTLVTMHILNYNICNTYFSIQNNTQKNQMITTLSITHMLQSYNTCKFENIQLQHLQL